MFRTVKNSKGLLCMLICRHRGYCSLASETAKVLTCATADYNALTKVIASSEESKNHWQQKDYKGFNSSTDWDTADFSKVRFCWRCARSVAYCLLAKCAHKGHCRSEANAEFIQSFPAHS